MADDTLADGTWLRSIGAVRPMAAAADEVYVLGKWQACMGGNLGAYPIMVQRERKIGRIKMSDPYVLYAFGGKVREKPTRKQVRALAAALGVELAESR